MTEEEVKLIYDYLHANYQYEDGNLIRTSPAPKNKRVQVGDRLGSFFYQGKQTPRLRSTICVGGKQYTKHLAHLIYLYHTKKIPSVIEYVDGNPTNCFIENLKSSSRVNIEFKKSRNVRGWKPVKSTNGSVRYRVTLQIGKDLKVHFGSCETQEEARKVYDLAKTLHVHDQLNPQEIKLSVMKAFPHLLMKLKKENVCGYEGVYQRGKRFVARNIFNKKTNCSTHDTPEEAYQAYLLMKEGYFNRTNRIKISGFCIIENCKSECYCKGLCSLHYSQEIRKKHPRKLRENKTGFQGVRADKGRFSSRHNGKHLGMFDSPEEAHAAYLKAKEEYANQAT